MRSYLTLQRDFLFTTKTQRHKEAIHRVRGLGVFVPLWCDRQAMSRCRIKHRVKVGATGIFVDREGTAW